MADAEALAQFRELQKSYVEATGKLKTLASQGRVRDTERQRCALTLAELVALPESVATFKGLGRACVASQPFLLVLSPHCQLTASLPQLRAAAQAVAGGGAAGSGQRLRGGTCEAQGESELL